MLHSISQLSGSSIHARDGDIGKVEQAYFDDQKWTIRYLVVNTGSWLSGRNVLISPYAVEQAFGGSSQVVVNLTREQVEHSPSIDTHEPVSRRHERDFADYYAYPEYWTGDALWAMSAMPLIPPPLQSREELETRRADREKDVAPEDLHLRSSENVHGYDILATDGSIGHVKDYLFDDDSWTIRYLVVDTRNWWPGGKKVLIAPHWIERIDWVEKTVQVNLSREQVKTSPAYDEAQSPDRVYEERLHEAYDRKGYWD